MDFGRYQAQQYKAGEQADGESLSYSFSIIVLVRTCVKFLIVLQLRYEKA